MMWPALIRGESCRMKFGLHGMLVWVWKRFLKKKWPFLRHNVASKREREKHHINRCRRTPQLTKRARHHRNAATPACNRGRLSAMHFFSRLSYTYTYNPVLISGWSNSTLNLRILHSNNCMGNTNYSWCLHSSIVFLLVFTEDYIQQARLCHINAGSNLLKWRSCFVTENANFRGTNIIITNLPTRYVGTWKIKLRCPEDTFHGRQYVPWLFASFIPRRIRPILPYILLCCAVVQDRFTTLDHFVFVHDAILLQGIRVNIFSSVTNLVQWPWKGRTR